MIYEMIRIVNEKLRTPARPTGLWLAACGGWGPQATSYKPGGWEGYRASATSIPSFFSSRCAVRAFRGARQRIAQTAL